MQLYTLDGLTPFAARLTAALGVAASPHEERVFEDGECKWRPLVDPRGECCVVLASLHGGVPAPPASPGSIGAAPSSPHDKLVRLLVFAATLRDHGAARVLAVLPYLAYARKDRRTKPFDPLSLRYVATLMEAAGIDEVVVLEAHDVAALQNAFRIPCVHIESHAAFDAIAANRAAAGPIAVASPDPGGVKRVLLWREHLQSRLGMEVGFAMVDKRRSAGVVSSLGLVAGDVKGMSALVFDDLIASGETMRRAARALREAGAREVVALAAHGLFIAPAAEVLADEGIGAVVVTDSVPPFRLPAGGPVTAKLEVVSAAELVAQAVRRCVAGAAADRVASRVASPGPTA